ncbi:MAG: hypothetical protein MUF12_07805 [Sediminibacterium sp.]|jgi:hypothetical protein|nr:hypothetical protein [Sediminibacterium sp.]
MIEQKKHLPLHLYVRVLGGLMLIYITYQVHTTIDNFPIWLLLMSYFIFGLGTILSFIRLFKETPTSEKIEERKEADKSLKDRILYNLLWSIPAMLLSLFLLYQKGEMHLLKTSQLLKIGGGWIAALLVISFVQNIYWKQRR